MTSGEREHGATVYGKDIEKSKWKENEQNGAGKTLTKIVLKV